MSRSKKFYSSLVIALVLVALISSVAMAMSTPTGGVWTEGKYNGGNGYEMAYSYYYNQYYGHYAHSDIDGYSENGTQFANPGYSASSNSQSRPLGGTGHNSASDPYWSGADTWLGYGQA
jgi:hypothetical protein